MLEASSIKGMSGGKIAWKNSKPGNGRPLHFLLPARVWSMPESDILRGCSQGQVRTRYSGFGEFRCEVRATGGAMHAPAVLAYLALL